jgi:hypothetical protein
MMEAVCTSETPVHFNLTTRCYVPGDSKLQELRKFGRQVCAKGCSWIQKVCFRGTSKPRESWLQCILCWSYKKFLMYANKIEKKMETFYVNTVIIHKNPLFKIPL